MRKKSSYNQLALDFTLAPVARTIKDPGSSWAQWAADMLKSDAVILDTETTGLDKQSQIISLAIIDMQGRALFNTLLRPTVAIHPGAQAIHGITYRQIANAPTLAHVVGQVTGLLSGRKVLIYNVAFDLRMLRQSLDAAGLDRAWVEELSAECAMKAAAQAYSDGRQKLEGNDHTALGDCIAVLELIKRMAQG